LEAKDSLILLYLGQFFLQIPYLIFELLDHSSSDLATSAPCPEPSKIRILLPLGTRYKAEYREYIEKGMKIQEKILASCLVLTHFIQSLLNQLAGIPVLIHQPLTATRIGSEEVAWFGSLNRPHL
jgi:hypothetical protein